MAESFGVRSGQATRLWKYWLPVTMMLGLMYYLSTDLFSGANTLHCMDLVLHLLHRHPQGNGVSDANHLMRKAAHMLEYAMLVTLLFRAFRADSPLKWKVNWAVYSLLLSISWAFVDELVHQAHTRSRSGSIWDVVLDAGGALGALLVLAMLDRRGARWKAHSAS